MKTLIKLRLPVLFAALLLCGAAFAAEGELTLGVVPQFPALEIHRTWTPVAKAIEAAVGRPVQLKIYQSIPLFEQDFLSGGPDIVYLNPYHMVMANRARGYVPLVRDSAQQLSGILFVQAGSPIARPGDLDGKQIAFPAPNAFGASLLLRALLTEEYKVKFTPSYVQTHSNAYRYVARGDAAAAGGIRSTYEHEPEELRSRLKVIYETPRYASHPVAVHPRVSADLRAKISKAILQMRQNAEGTEQLKEITMSEPVMADYRRDYGALEKLNLDRYAVLAK